MLFRILFLQTFYILDSRDRKCYIRNEIQQGCYHGDREANSLYVSYFSPFDTASAILRNALLTFPCMRRRMVRVTLRPPSDWTLVGSMLQDVRAVLEWDVLRRRKSTVVFQPVTCQTRHHTKHMLTLLYSHIRPFSTYYFNTTSDFLRSSDTGSLVNIHYIIV